MVATELIASYYKILSENTCIFEKYVRLWTVKDLSDLAGHVYPVHDQNIKTMFERLLATGRTRNTSCSIIVGIIRVDLIWFEIVYLYSNT